MELLVELSLINNRKWQVLSSVAVDLLNEFDWTLQVFIGQSYTYKRK